MERKNISLVVALVLLLASTSLTFSQSSEYTDDPAYWERITSRNELEIKYESFPHYDIKSRLAKSNAFLSSLNPVQPVILDFSEKALLGRITVQLKPSLAAIDSLTVSVRIRQESSVNVPVITVAESVFDEYGRAVLEIPGKYTEEVHLSLNKSVSADSPFETISVESITLNENFRLLLVGDSVTHGFVGSSTGLGFRQILYNGLRAIRRDIDFVGSYGDPPYEGHFLGGTKVRDFLPNRYEEMDMKFTMNTSRPHMVAIHLGTNDLNNNATTGPYRDQNGFTETTSGHLGILIDYLLKWHNGENGDELQYVVVSLIIPAERREAQQVLFNNELSKMVHDFRNGVLTGQPEPVFVCDHYSRFEENPFLWIDDWRDIMFDKLHPNDRGYEIMAETYLDCISELIIGPKWFSDLSWEMGIAAQDKYWSAQGIAVADITGDGLDDIYMSRASEKAEDPRDFFFVNKSTIPLADRSVDYQINDLGVSRGVVFADIDNDGDFDLFNGQEAGQNHLYENNGASAFVNISSQAGIEVLPDRKTTSVLAFDCENDGDIDLFCVNSQDRNEQYLNNGAGRFKRVNYGFNDAEEPNIHSMSGSAADFDMDGDVDVYIAKRNGANKLYINDGSGHFQDRAVQLGVDLSAVDCNGVIWSDLDNDADLDLLVTTNSDEKIPDIKLQLFRNNGNGTFTGMSDQVNIFYHGYSALVADFDNDGDMDIITTHEGTVGEFWRNDGDWTFREVEDTGAEIFNGDVRAATVFDADNDGDQDLLAMRNDCPNIFLRNNLDNNYNYLKVKAYGPNGNIGGFGTKVWLYQNGKLGNPQALLGYREIMSATGHQSQYSPTLHYGLALEDHCDLLARFTDGTWLALRNVGVNQTLVIRPDKPSGQAGEPAIVDLYSGDGQQKMVGEMFDEPFVVQVRDGEGQPVKDVAVEFGIKTGNAQIVEPVVNQENIWKEMENAALDNTVRWVYDATSSGNGFIWVPDFLGNSGEAVVTASIESGRDYVLWIRASHSNQSRSVTLQVDNYPVRSVEVSSENWKWYRVSNTSGGPELYSLSAGDHNVVLNFGDFILIDRILLSPDINYTPLGTGDSGENPDLTDINGLAGRMVQLGTSSGLVEIEASARIHGSHISGSPALFTATARPGPAAKFHTEGSGQIGSVGEPLEQPFTVIIQDVFSNYIKDVPVTFQVTAGGGTILPDGEVMTNALGRASTVLTPGDQSSLQRVSATITGLSTDPIVFQAAVPGVASEINYISGTGQADTVGNMLADPLSVRILNDQEQPVPSYPVKYKIVQGDGRLSFSRQGKVSDTLLQVLSNENGYANIFWTMGPESGEQRVQAIAQGLTGSPVLFRATATPRHAYRLMPVSGNDQSAPLLSLLPNPFVVRVLDEFHNPVSNHSVTFTCASENGIFPRSNSATYSTLSDSNGYVSTQFRLGEDVGENLYHIKVNSSHQQQPLQNTPVDFYASGKAGLPSRAFKLTQDGQVDTVNHILDQPFRVRITDQFSNPVEDYVVTFSVIKGGGSIDGQQEVTRQTNLNGIAEARLKLGSAAGSENHHVAAFFTGITPNEIIFKASAVADYPVALEYVSGNDQKSPFQTTLPMPFVVRVEDQFKNGVAGHPVLFTVQGDQGHFGGMESITVNTDEFGDAQAYLTLGEEIGDSNNVVLASSLYQGVPLSSPVQFYASTSPAYPVRLIPISDDKNILGAANRELPDPVIVKVLDEEDKGVPGIAVNFTIESGDGYFAPEQQNATSVTTDKEGLSRARWVLGSADQIQKISAAVIYNNAHLINSPKAFQAVAIETRAKMIELVSENEFNGQAGKALQDSLVVRILDEFGQPLKNHPVRFEIQQGDATLTAEGAGSLLVYSDEEGLARSGLILGGTAGSNTCVVYARSSSAQGTPLTGSPVLFSVDVVAGDPDMSESSISSTSLVPLNGASKAEVEVLLRDRFGNPVANRTVELVSNPAGLIFSAENSTTDFTGKYYAEASAVNSGDFQIRARDQESGLWLQESALVTFFESDAQKFFFAGGNNQVGYPHSLLEEMLQVRVLDVNDRPVSNYPVVFTANADSIATIYDDTLYTDKQGIGKTAILIGPYSGTVTVAAHAAGLKPDHLIFNQTIRSVSRVVLVNEGEDRISKNIDDIVPDTLRIRIQDMQGRPVGATRLLFSTEASDIARPQSEERISDKEGRLTMPLIFGPQTGTTRILVKPDASLGAALAIDVEVSAGAPHELQVYGGNEQSVVVNNNLEEALQVRVVDKGGHPLQEVGVIFSVEQGFAVFLDETRQVSDQQGITATRMRMGTLSGRTVILARLEDQPTISAAFVCHGLPDAPYELKSILGDKQVGIAGHKLNLDLKVQIRDKYGNGIPQASVSFMPQTDCGKTYPSGTVLSDSNGIAAVSWVLGPKLGLQSIDVRKENLVNSPIQFTANAIPNNAPVIDIPDQFVLDENEPFQFDIFVTDEENDPFSIFVPEMPDRAYIDSMTFYWQPGFDQAGSHRLVFIAQDSGGAKSEKSVTFSVNNVNRPPYIIDSRSVPVNRNIGSIKNKWPIDFHVEAKDPDEDFLHYLWMVNGVKIGATADFRFEAQLYSGGDKIVQVLVFDAHDTVGTSWQLDLLTPVELTSFTATFEPFNGITLAWETRLQRQTLGYYLYRSDQPDENFTLISELIEPNDEGKYVYEDIADIDHRVYYLLKDMQIDGVINEHPVISVEPMLPDDLELAQNYPNPFNPQTHIRFALPEPAFVSLRIYNIRGHQVMSLAEGERKAGYHSVNWNGRNTQNKPVAAGVYYYVLDTPLERRVKKMVLIR
ncbi:T9SS type A sorting domain-containing protein [candidate division KSB1 bacterium]|nr:T9SS type A sorting domain-containing protein [candidate division KSB1 bacterium]